MVPAGGGGGGGGNESNGGGGNTGTEQAPPNLAAPPPQQPDSQQQQQQQQQQQHSQHPPPSPLSGCYLLVVLPEAHSTQHKDLILNRLSKGFLSWDKDSCHVDLEKELQALVAQAPEGEEARNGERLIQYATENLVTEVLIYPQSNTLLQCIRNLLASFTKHRHIIHAGYTFGGNGSWILQDGTFSLSDFLDAFSEHEVQRVLRAYENSVTVDIHCASVGDWTTTRFSREACTRACRVRVNPDDVLTAGVPAITNFTNYIGQYLIAQTLDQLMEPSDVVGNIRFSHPTLYVFPGGQGDAALFGINGFNMLVDGGFARKACFWDFARHLDRLDAVLVTRINNSNIGGMSSVLRKKKEMYVYPQIGHFFCNLVERRHSNSPDGDKDIDPLILDLIDIGQEMIVNLRHINLRPHPCYRDPEPINLYHKVGHGTLDMYVLSPSKDSREVREFLAKWSISDSKLFAGSHKKDPNSIIFPIQNLVSICAMLVWQPANPEDTITRILFPGSTPQNKIFEGFERLKHLEFLKRPVCTAKSLSPSTSLATLKDKHSILKPKLSSIERETKRLVEGRREKRDSSEVKAVKKDPVIEESAAKISTSKPILPSVPKTEIKAKKVVENKKLESEVKESKKIEKELKESKVDVKKVERSEGSDVEMKKTDVVKAETEKTVPVRDPKIHKTEVKKKDIKDTSKMSTKLSKVDSGTKPSFKSVEKKSKVVGEKKDVIKSSPTTPKKSINSTTTKADIPRTGAKSVVKITSKIMSSAPAKSTKDANNRMVVEQKNIELSSMATSSGSITGTKAPMKVKAIERKPLSRRTKPVSPSKARLPISPAKSARSTPSTSVKSDKDAVIRKVKGGTADSSAVSTPTGIESETAIKLIDKNLTEKSEDMSLDSIESKVLADLKEEREVVEEIEAVLQKAERIEEARKEERFEGDDEITAEATDKKEEDVTEEDVTAEMDEIPKKISRKESQEFTEEDEYLIVEKEEIYTEDSVQSGDTEQKHHLDEAESEKIKEGTQHKVYSQVEEKEFSDEKKDEMPEKKVDLYPEPKKTTELSPEHKELLKEEMKQIIASAKEVIKKTEEKDESGKRGSEDITKDPVSLSPDKLDMLKPEVELKEVMIEKLDESQERISTLESGATTTAPTLPEDERIPLDEIKEDVDEKHAIEEVKEKCILVKQTEDIPETLPVISKAEVKVLDVGPLTQQGIIRDVVKTPDEVADLPVHEEVDPKLYRLDDLDKEKDLKATLLQEQKESTIASTVTPAKETKDKGVFSFFGKVADKFEKGIDILTKKTRRDSEKDVEDKSSKSSSPKELKPQEKISIGGTSFDRVVSKTEKSGEKAEISFELKSGEGSEKKSIALDNSSFLESEKKESQNNVMESITSPESKTTVSRKDVGEDIDDTDEVEAFVEEASKKFRNVKDSLQDSLESLDEKVDDSSKLPFNSKGAVSNTLSEVAEKLIDIKPDLSSLLESKEPEKVKFIIPSNEELEDDADSGGVIRDFKEAVRDVAEVLVGTAGIEIEKEEKPKDVEEIVKKVAKVLKTDDFLSDQSTVMDKNLTENLVIPKKVGITEELSVQEEVKEFLEKELIDTSTKSFSKTDVFEIKKETCSSIDNQIAVKAKSDKEEAMRLCDDIMSAEHIIDYDTEPDTKQDVMDLGLEEICIKKTAIREDLEEKLDEKIVVQPEITFDQNLSPGKVELVTVTPGSTPTSPKIPTEEQFADLPTEYTTIFNKNESLESLIEDFIICKNHKITKQILEYIATIKSVPKDKIVSIIHEIIIKRNISRDNVADNMEVLRINGNISSEKRLEIENYVYNQYLNKNNKIILSTIEEISDKEMIPKHLVIEIIEEIIVKKEINRESVFDIDKNKYLLLYKEGLETPGEDKAFSSITVETSDENVVDGFVSIPSTETVKALQSQDDSKILDDFEAVEQEYKVSGISSMASAEKLISEKHKQEMADDVSDVIEADEKFVKETFEKDIKEDDSSDKEQIKDDKQISVQNLEISEADTKEKYLDEDKEKNLAVTKTAIYEKEEVTSENETTLHIDTSKEIVQKDKGKEFHADVPAHSENINIHGSKTKDTEDGMPQSLLKLSATATISKLEKDKLEDLKTGEQQSNKPDTLCSEIEMKSISTAKSVIEFETSENTVEERSESPGEEKLIAKEDISSEIIADSEKLTSVKEKMDDKSKSPSIEKEVHKIDVSLDSKEIPQDSETLIDKITEKSKSPSAEKEDEKSECSTDKPIILDDLKTLSDTTEERSNIKEKTLSLEREIANVAKLNVGQLGDKSISLSVEKETIKTEISSTLIESEAPKTVIKTSEEKSKLPCFEKELEKSDDLPEKLITVKDAQLPNSKLGEIYLLSESMIPLEIGSDSSTIMKDSLAIENSDDLLKTVKVKKEEETKLISPEKDQKLDEKHEHLTDQLLQSTVLPEKTSDGSKSPSVEKEEIKTETSFEKVISEDLKTALDKSGGTSKPPEKEITKESKEVVCQLDYKSKSPSVEKDAVQTSLDKAVVEDASKHVSDQSKVSITPSSAEVEEQKTKESFDKDIVSDMSIVVDDKLQDRSKSSSLEKDAGQQDILPMKDGSKSPSLDKDAVEKQTSPASPSLMKDSNVISDKSNEKSRSPSTEKDDGETKDTAGKELLAGVSTDKSMLLEQLESVVGKTDVGSKSPSNEKEITQTEILFAKETSLEDAKVAETKSEDSLRSPSVEKDMSTPPSKDIILGIAEESAAYLTSKKSPSIDKELEKTEISLDKEVLLEDIKSVYDKPQKSRSPSSEKEEKMKDSSEQKRLSEDSKTVTETLGDRSKSSSEEKELSSSDNLTDKLLQSTVLPEKTSDGTKSPSVEKEEIKTETSFEKVISEDLKTALDESGDSSKPPEKVITGESQKGQLDYKSKSPSVEKDAVQTSLDKAVVEDASIHVSDQSKVSITPSSAEVEEQKTKESFDKDIVSDMSIVVDDKLQDRSKSSSLEKDAGQQDILPSEDRSKSPSLEMDAVEKQTSPASPSVMKDSNVISDKSNEKSRSPSTEKDDGEKKDTAGKELLAGVSTDKSMLLEQLESVVGKTDVGSKSPSNEKEITQTEILFAKETSLEDAKVAETKSEDSLRSPSVEKDMSTPPSKDIILGIAEESAAYLTSKKSPSIDKELEKTEISLDKEVLLEDIKSVSAKPQKSRSPSSEKEVKMKDSSEQKRLSEDSKAVMETLGDRSKSSSEEKELSSSDNLTDKLLQSTVLPEKTSDGSKSPSVEKEEIKIETSFEKVISEDLKTALDKSGGSSKPPEKEITEESKEVVCQLDYKSKSPSVEKDAMQTSLDKAVVEDASKHVSDQSKVSITPSSAEVEEQKTKESFEKDIVSDMSIVVDDKLQDRSKSSSFEKDAGQQDILPSEDRSKSPSLEKDSVEKQMSPASPSLMKDSNVISDKSNEKSRSPSTEKDDGEKKDTTGKEVLAGVSTDESMLLEQLESVVGKTHVGSKSPSNEKEVTQTEILFAKETSLDDAKETFVLLKEKSGSPIDEKEEDKTKETYKVGKLESSVNSADTPTQLEKPQPMTEKTGDGSHSPNISKEPAETKSVITKEMPLEVIKAEPDNSEKSRSPSAEKDIEKTKDSSVKQIISEDMHEKEELSAHVKTDVGEVKDRSDSPTEEKEIQASEDSTDKLIQFEKSEKVIEKTGAGSHSPSIEKELTAWEETVKKEISLEDMKAVSEKSDKSRSPSSEKDEEKLKAIHKEEEVSKNLKSTDEKFENKLKSPSGEKRFETSEDSADKSIVLEKSETVIGKAMGGSHSPSIEKELTNTEEIPKKEISPQEADAPSDKSDKSRSPSSEKDEEKFKAIDKEEKLSESLTAADGKLDDKLNMPSEEKRLETLEHLTEKSIVLEKSEKGIEKIGAGSHSPSVEKELTEMAETVKQETSLEDMKAVSEKSDRSRSPSSEKDEEKLKAIHKEEEVSNNLKATDGKFEDKLKSPSEEKRFETSEGSTDKSIVLDKSETVIEKTMGGSHSPSIEKELTKTEEILKKEILLQDANAPSDKSVKSRSPSSEKDEEKFKAIDKEENLSRSLTAADGKLDDKLNLPSEERRLETSEHLMDKSIVLEKSEKGIEKTRAGSHSPSVEKELTEMAETVKQETSLEDMKAVSDKSDKSRSPSSEKDEEKFKAIHKEEEVSINLQAADEKLDDVLKSAIEEKRFETSEDSADKSIVLDKSETVIEKAMGGSHSPSIEKELTVTEEALKKETLLEETKAVSDKSDKSRSPSSEKDEEKFKAIHKEEEVSINLKAVDGKFEDKLKSPSEEKRFETSEDSVDKSIVLEKSDAAVEKAEIASHSPSIEKQLTESKESKTADGKVEDKLNSHSEEKKVEVSEDSSTNSTPLGEPKAADHSTSMGIQTELLKTETSPKNETSLEDVKTLSDKSVKSRSPSSEKDDEKLKDIHKKVLSEDSKTEVGKVEGRAKAPLEEKEIEASEDSAVKSMLLEISSPMIEKVGDGSHSPTAEVDVIETEKLLKKETPLEETKAVSDKSDKPRSPSTEKDEDKMGDSYVKKNVSEQSETTLKALGDSSQSVSTFKRLETWEDSTDITKDNIESSSMHRDLLEMPGAEKLSVASPPELKDVGLTSKTLVDEKSLHDDCLVDDKGKDRSRSQSVFETGDKSPLLRSRSASLYDDKLSDKLANQEVTKDYSKPDHAFEEKDELHLSDEVLDDLQKEIFKRHLENERYANMEIKKLIADNILNKFISKKKIISHQIIEELANNYNVDIHVVIGIISELITYLKIDKKTVFDLEDKIFEESTQKILEDEEKLTILINDQYIAKKKIINSNTIDEIAISNSVSRHLVILVIENIIIVRRLRRESVVSEDVFDTEETMFEFEQDQEKALIQQAASTEEQSNITLDDVRSFKSTPLYKSERPEPHIDEEIIISENRRREMEALMIDDYIDRGIKITESVLEQIVRRTSLPKHIIIEIIEEIIMKKGLAKEIIANLSIFHDEDYRDSQQKNALETTERKLSDYSIPESQHYNDNPEKSISYADYESPFHKAFVGGMTEIRTTHITTLSGKSTPELGARDGTPDSSSEIVGTVLSTVSSVSEKVEKADDDRVDDHGQIDQSQCKTNEQEEQVEKSFDEIHSEAYEKDTRQIVKQESLPVKISPDKEIDKVPEDSVHTLKQSVKASNEEEKLSMIDAEITASKSVEDSKQQEGGEKACSDKDLIEHSGTEQLKESTLLIKDLIQDENSSKESISDVSMPKDVSFGDPTGKCTSEVSMSPLIRDGSMIQSHLSGRSTPDKRSDNRSRTATPEGFRSGDVIRTIITTTRTMSDDGEIITTTREVTEATNEKGETVVLTEKTDVKVDDKLPENVISESKAFDISSSEVTDKEADLISPRSDLSSGHSRAATNVWESSEERQTFSDEEQSSSPFFPSARPAEQKEDESDKVKGQSKTESISSTAMSSSFYGELPSEPAHFDSSLTTVSDTVSFTEQDEFSFKKFTVEKEYAGVFEGKGSKKYVDEADLDFEKALTGLEGEKAGEKGALVLGESSFSQELEKSSSSHPDDKKKDPLADWGSPLGLPSPKAPRKFNLRSPVQACSSADLSPDSLNFDVINDWGEPMRLPSPAPATNELSNKGSPGTPKKEKKQAKKVISENLKNKKRSDSPSKNEKKVKDSKNKVQPVYLDLAYVSHHGNSFYTALEFFKKVRARYYVFSGTEPSREVYDALLEAKKTWEDKELEVTMIPTYDTDTLGYWVADNEEALAAHHIDLSPSASRCTINLQDHETSCSAYRLEF